MVSRQNRWSSYSVTVLPGPVLVDGADLELLVAASELHLPPLWSSAVAQGEPAEQVTGILGDTGLAQHLVRRRDHAAGAR